MTDGKQPITNQMDDEACRRGAALAEVYKAMKTLGFYPNGHPLCAESLRQAHHAMALLLSAAALPLVITRTGFSPQDGGAVVAPNPMTLALARELFIRRVKRVTLLEDLSLEDLCRFLLLLTIDPQKIAADGGMEKLMVNGGIKTIWANEIDLSVIWEKRQALEAADSGLASSPGEEGGGGAMASAAPGNEALLSANELVDLMNKERDDDRYLQLARMLAAKAEEIKEGGDFLSLFPVVKGLSTQCADEGRSPVQREYAMSTLERVAGGKMTEFLLRQLESKAGDEYEQIYRIFQQLGEKAARVIIQRLCIAEGRFARKALSTALVKIGDPAVPPLLAMLQDERWYVVRNLVAILGEIGCRQCLDELKPALCHGDPRVRKEAVRTIAKIGGREAESAIVGLLADGDPAIIKQAIHSLGVMKSQAAVQPLLEMVAKRDIFLKSLHLKVEALQAIGRIGDKRATPYLLRLLDKSPWFARSKWEELKISVAEALGKLNDEKALPALKIRGAHGRLGSACVDAADNIEKAARVTHE